MITTYISIDLVRELSREFFQERRGFYVFLSPIALIDNGRGVVQRHSPFFHVKGMLRTFVRMTLLIVFMLTLAALGISA